MSNLEKDKAELESTNVNGFNKANVKLAFEYMVNTGNPNMLLSSPEMVKAAAKAIIPQLDKSIHSQYNPQAVATLQNANFKKNRL